MPSFGPTINPTGFGGFQPTTSPTSTATSPPTYTPVPQTSAPSPAPAVDDGGMCVQPTSWWISDYDWF